MTTETMDRDDLDVIEAILSWGGDILAMRHLPMGSAVSIGEHAYCTFFAPAEQIGTDLALVLPEGSTLAPEQPLEADFGPFRVALRAVPAGRPTPLGALARWKDSALGGVGTSFAMHALIFGSLALFLPALTADDDVFIARDRIETMQKYLAGAAERERDNVDDESAAREGARESAPSGKQAPNEAGLMGRETAPKTNAHWSAKGDATPQDASLARERDLTLAREFGLVGMLGSSPLSDPNAPITPWGTVPNGADAESHLGAMWGSDPGENFGIGGLSLSGVGEGGGCPPGMPNCGQIGLANIGESLGHGFHDGRGSCIGPNCGPGNNGMGYSHGRMPGGHPPRAPNPRPCEDKGCGFEAMGRIPPEVIQRIVRQNAGRYRACYELGLRNNPSLNGHVRVKFVIDRGGAVSMAQDSGSDLPDENVRSCVVKSFYSLAFPTPEGGTVRVVYPIMFNPTE
ncbi:AgmX/PglI C-terminal domain-containing protein [Pendulispora rubella]|uniref:AgmX/PglI C-terminal domain-containing protein n=1 Tax=Pendulispora rubella TaxID=2741070 RepID=A0ABZ2L854_9BACT